MNKKEIEILKQFFIQEFPSYKKYIERDFDKIKVKEGGFITLFLKLFGYRGICLFRHIYYVKGSVSDKDMAKFIVHELTHTIQYRREGIISFPIKYLISVIKDGYKNSKYEEEADYYSKMFFIWCKKDKIKFDIS
jgi:hypothetical protein